MLQHIPQFSPLFRLLTSKLSHTAFGILVVVACCCNATFADVVVFDQPASITAGQYKSAWFAPDGLDSDEYVWDDFTLTASTAITQIHWRGVYANQGFGFGTAPVTNFTVDIYRSSIAGSPDLQPGGRLAHFVLDSNAAETPVGTMGNLNVYNYSFTLPAPFQAVGGTKYWVQIEAWQGIVPPTYWPPDWSLQRGTGGNNSHFRHITDGMYQNITGDTVFSLYASSAPTVTINASASPTIAGTITGAGSYPVGSTATLHATANAGFGFVNWTEGAAQISTNTTYTFTANTDRTLVAHFAPSFNVYTASYPLYGGSITGAGQYLSGSTATLIATPAPHFGFAGWSDGSMDAIHQVTITSDIWYTAFFEPAPGVAVFDFDAGPVHTSLPVTLVNNGVSANFSGTDGSYSIQPAGTFGFTPLGFSGNALYPNSVFPADLIVDFSELVTDFSVLYSPQELGCDNSARMRATAYLNGLSVATNTTTASVPGTWPSETLTVAEPNGFNRVVVHYDARPPTCQDWGPIFLADNVIVKKLCITPCGPTCDSIDFNNDTSLFDPQDIDAFLSVYSEGPCIPETATCNDIDFNNDNSVFDPCDIDSFLLQFSEGPCTLCGA